jgi:hypothetical protein
MKGIKQVIEESLNLTEAVNWKIVYDRKYVWSPKSRYIQIEISGHTINYSYLTEQEVEEIFMDINDNIANEMFLMKAGDYYEVLGKIYFCIR